MSVNVNKEVSSETSAVWHNHMTVVVEGKMTIQFYLKTDQGL